jgi:hypothetical protein
MPKSITWKAQASITGGPSTSSSQSIPIDACDEITNTLGASATVHVLVGRNAT